MPSYKLIYFNARGRAEVIRQIFALAGEKFEDFRYSKEEWPSHKKEVPFGQIPVLEVDGAQLPQTLAIARYISKKFGLAGKTDFETAWVDAIADQFNDYFVEYRPLRIVLAGMVAGDKEKLREEVGEPARDKFYSLIEKRLGESKSGFLVGDDVTWVDLMVAENVDIQTWWMPGFLDAYPKVLAHRTKVHSLPRLKEYLAQRKETQF